MHLTLRKYGLRPPPRWAFTKPHISDAHLFQSIKIHFFSQNIGYYSCTVWNKTKRLIGATHANCYVALKGRPIEIDKLTVETDVPNTADEGGARGDASHLLQEAMAAQEQGAASVCRNGGGWPDLRFGEYIVHGQSDHVLGLDHCKPVFILQAYGAK